MLVWRICAVCMLLLSASPFTAPFATFDFGDPHHDVSTEPTVKVTMHEKVASISVTTIPEATALRSPDARPAAGGGLESVSGFLERCDLHQILRL